MTNHSHTLSVTAPLRTRIREIRKMRGLTLKQLAHDLHTTPQTIQRLETDNMTISTRWLDAIAKALDVPPTELLVKPERSIDDDFRQRMHNELIRTRRTVPSFDDAPFTLFEATGSLAGILVEWQKGLRGRDELVTACAATAAAAMRIALDAGMSEVEVPPATPQLPKLVVNQS